MSIQQIFPQFSEQYPVLFVLLELVFGFALAFLVAKAILLPIVVQLNKKTKRRRRRFLFPNSLQKKTLLFFVLTLLYLYINQSALATSSLFLSLKPLFLIVLLFSFVNLLLEIINLMERLLLRKSFAANAPIKTLTQVAKIIVVILFLIVSISLLTNKSPALVISGFGAMTAVLMLLFKDTILGFVAGIQLSANKMVAVGDWVEMPKYDANGSVTEISLTTVKVSNWDKTITTIPAYALISDSFKNWRGMVESGGRRIKRTVMIDLSTVHFLSEEEVERLKKMWLLKEYIEEKLSEIKEHNEKLGISPEESSRNGRHLTNLGTFRAYISRYLEEHPLVHSEMTRMVRQLEPRAEGVPLEVYCFINDTRWVNYENAQSDIFDHIFAVVSEFNLKIYQSPSGRDLQNAFGAIHPKSEELSDSK